MLALGLLHGFVRGPPVVSQFVLEVGEPGSRPCRARGLLREFE